MDAATRAVRVAVDAVADRPERTFSYLLPDALGPAEPGSLLLVPYGRRLALGYLMPGLPNPPQDGQELRPAEAIVSAAMPTGLSVSWCPRVPAGSCPCPPRPSEQGEPGEVPL